MFIYLLGIVVTAIAVKKINGKLKNPAPLLAIMVFVLASWVGLIIYLFAAFAMGLKKEYKFKNLYIIKKLEEFFETGV